MAPKRSPRNSSGSKKSPRQSKGEKDSANDADAEARRKKEELARKVRERLKAKQAAEAAKKDGGSGKRERGSDDATGDQETEKASSKRRRTDDPAPTPATTAEIQPARDDDSSQPGDGDRKDAPAAEKGKDPAADLAAQMRERRERAAAAAAADDDDAPGVSDRRPPGWTLDADEDLAGMADDDDDDETPSAANEPGTVEDEEDVDPLEAFMAANDSVMDAERAAAAERNEEREARLAKKREAREAATAEAEVAADFFAAAAKAAKAAKAAVAAEGVGDNDVTPGATPATDPDTGLPPLTKKSDDDDDPLDAFMRANNAKAEAAVARARARVPAPAVRTKPAGQAATNGGAQLSMKPTVLKKPAFGGSAFLRPGITVKKPANGGLARPPVKRDENGGGGGGRAVKKIGLVRRFFDADSDGGDTSDSGGGGADSDTDGAGSDDDAEWARKQQSRMSKADKLGVADHDSIDYPPFRKNFYIESYEIARMTKAEVKELRAELEGIRCRGKDVPRPIKTWAQAGLSNRVMELIRRSGFDKPMPIQCQALPVIMSGRDCIGVAKTGSGKTLSYVLPMLRHVKDQRPIESGDGPIGMIMGPTRELVTQIGKDCKKFGRAAGLVAVSVYGGSGVATQIGELKRGCEIVACTPGRMIDVLTTGAGRITNLRRVTYMVLDEADRMFDMGFEPQITRIMNNLRPDRQTVMFSATFPHAMEALARSALTNPVEIQVGGRSVVNSDIEQIVEMRAEEDRFLRVLELLGEWYERGKIIIFVASQDKCDQVFRDLLRSGYPCLSLHGGKEQTDRECTIADFKSDVCNILVATSVAARGLDVKDLRLVVNYDTPNHLEDYVHRVGRTGRAGNKGTAVTFISQEEEKFAPDLVKAMTDAKQPVPGDLKTMADEYAKKKKEGLVVGGKSSGFGGSGFKFSREEQDAEKRAKKAAALAAGLEVQADDESDSDDEGRFDDDGEPIFQSVGRSGAAAAAAATTAEQAAAAEQVARAAAMGQAAGAAAFGGGAPAAAMGQAAPVHPAPAPAPAAYSPPPQPEDPKVALLNAAARAAAAKIGSSLGVGPTAAQGPTQAQVNAANNSQMSLAISQAANSMALVSGATTGAARAAAFAAALNAQHAAARSGVLSADGAHFESELEINDFPQQARWKVTHKDTLAQISEFTGAAITVKGQYYAPNKPVPPGERKLFLLIEGPSERCIKTAKGKIKEIIEEIIAKESLPGGFSTGKYKV